MACLTIRNLDDGLKVRLRLRAARHGCSMEAEARSILAQTLLVPADANSLVASIRARFAGIDAAGELSIPPRQVVRTPPELGA